MSLPGKGLKDNCKVRSSDEKDDNLSVNVEDLFVDSSDDSNDNDDEGHDDIALRDIVLVAHNGIRFDIPFLFKSFDSYAVACKHHHNSTSSVHTSDSP